MDDSNAGLPPAVELLWGLRDRSRRGGPRPALTLERIVAAAVELADAGGLPALSMSRLAEKLGFTTMSLYRYVASKEELLLLALDAAIAPPPDLDPAGGWRQRTERWARALLDFYRRHPWTLDLPISGLPAGPNQLLWFDRGLAALEETRMTEQELASSVLLVALYARNQAQLTADLVRAERLAAEAGSAPQPWAQVLTRLIDPDRFPALSKVVAAGVFDDDDDAAAGEEFAEDEFDFGLHRILDGIDALDRSRAPTG